MILAVTKKPEEYVSKMTGAGLYTQYGHNELLFNLISRTMTCMFPYEGGDFGEDKFIEVIYDDHLLVDTLEQDVASRSMKDILSTLDPWEMFSLFHTSSISHLAMSTMFESEKVFKASVLARALQWKKHFKGETARDGNVVQVTFRSSLTKEEEAVLKNLIRGL